MCRAIGVATNSTEEVGSVFMTAIHEHLPEFAPTAYLGDAAEAFANATRAVFPTVQIRLMCFAHVYKVSHTKSRSRNYVSGFRYFASVLASSQIK